MTNNPHEIHPYIQLFQAQSEVLDAQDDSADLHTAIVRLAAWMDLATDHLTEDDFVLLGSIGGILFREGMKSR